MSTSREFFGYTPARESVEAITLSAGQYTVRLISLGAAISNLWVPDRNGNILDVVCGYDTPEEYLLGKTHQGAVVGPVANRIAGASFAIDGKEYCLEANEGPNCLHSGNTGFSFSNWTVESLSDGSTPSVCFLLKLQDGKWGFPGNRSFRAQYTLTETGKLSLRLSGETDQITPVNITNHTYFNLEGYDSPDVLSHHLRVRSDSIAELNSAMIPTGRIIKIKGTPYDFSSGKKIGKDINRDYLSLKECFGYDVNYFLSPSDVSNDACATLMAPHSGVTMCVYTDQPCLQLYTSNSVPANTPAFKNGVTPVLHHAVRLEAQAMPDAPHHPELADIMLHPGEVYEKNIIFSFEREASAS